MLEKLASKYLNMSEYGKQAVTFSTMPVAFFDDEAWNLLQDHTWSMSIKEEVRKGKASVAVWLLC